MNTALFALALLLTPPPVDAAAQQYPVEVRLEPDRVLGFGEEVGVVVRTLRDGYLLVLHAEPSGRVRVLFPLDPLHDHYVRGARDYEIVGRGDRKAFRVHAESGVGTVYVAYSPDPFRADGLILGDHWDYRLDAWTVQGDPEAHLTALASRMAGDTPFEYDLARYDVAPPVAYEGGRYYHAGVYGSYAYHPYGYFGPGLGFAFASCGPFLFHSVYCYPFLYRSYFYGYPYGFGYYRGGFVVGGRHDRFRSRDGRFVRGPYRFKDRGATPRAVIRVRDRVRPDETATSRRRVQPDRVPSFDRSPPRRRSVPSVRRGFPSFDRSPPLRRTIPSVRQGSFPSRAVTPMRGRTPVRAAPPRSSPGRALPARVVRPSRRR